jgi:hypothetical protein
MSTFATVIPRGRANQGAFSRACQAAGNVFAKRPRTCSCSPTAPSHNGGSGGVGTELSTAPPTPSARPRAQPAAAHARRSATVAVDGRGQPRTSPAGGGHPRRRRFPPPPLPHPHNQPLALGNSAVDVGRAAAPGPFTPRQHGSAALSCIAPTTTPQAPAAPTRIELGRDGRCLLSLSLSQQGLARAGPPRPPHTQGYVVTAATRRHELAGDGRRAPAAAFPRRQRRPPRTHIFRKIPRDGRSPRSTQPGWTDATAPGIKLETPERKMPTPTPRRR